MLWFSDLRDFTGINERLPAAEVLELLNNYLQLVGDALGANGGEILKFIGDGVMGYFPAEDALFLPMVTGRPGRRTPADHDIEAANEARATGGREPVRFGIGLHVGDGDLRQYRHRGPARLHRHRPRRQPRVAAGEPDQGARVPVWPRPSSTPSAPCR